MHLLIDAYHTAKSDLFPIEDVIRRSINEGPSYTTVLKKLRLEIFVKFHRGEFFLQPDSNVKREPRLKDISEVPPYQYLINWQEPDSEDIKWSQIPTKITPRSIRAYKKIANDLLSEIPQSEVRVIEEKEVFFTSNDSFCLDGSPETGKAVLKWKKRSEPSSYKFDSNPLYGRRCLIQVGPGNLRDGVLLTIQQSNSIRIIEKQVWEIVTQVPGSAMTNSPRELKRMLRKFFDESFWYLSRDFKKEGWTKPLELLHALLDVLEKRYPSFPCWKYRGIFDHISVFDKSNAVKYDCIRGHGIGFANALTTLHSLTLFMLTMSKVDFSHFVDSATCYALAWNDDFVARFQNEDQAIEYFNTEGEVFEEYSVIRKDEACFYGEGFFHFLENYYAKGKMNSKRVYKFYLMYQAILCHNIVLAKAYVCSIRSIIDKEIYDAVLPEIISYFGYEFFPEEVNLPYSFGGWESCIILGIDTSLRNVDVYDFKNKAAYHACKARVSMKIFTKKSERKKDYVSPFQLTYPELVPFADDFIKDNFYIGYTIQDMNKIMTKFTRTSEITRDYYTRLLQRRRLEYEKYKDVYEDTESFVKNYISHNTLDTYPHHEFCELSAVKGLSSRLNYKIYRSEDPIQEYFRSLNGEKYSSKFPLYLQLRELIGNQNKLRFLDELEIALDCFSIAEYREELYSCDLYTSAELNEINLNEYYISPANVCKIAFAEGLLSMPIHSFAVERDILKEKAKIYGRMLTPLEEHIATINKFNRKHIIQCFRIDPSLIEAVAVIDESREYKRFIADELKTQEDEQKIVPTELPELLPVEFKVERKKRKIVYTLNTLYQMYIDNEKIPSFYWKMKRGKILRRIIDKNPIFYKVNPRFLAAVERLTEAFPELEPIIDIQENGFRVISEPLSPIEGDSDFDVEELIPIEDEIPEQTAEDDGW